MSTALVKQDGEVLAIIAGAVERGVDPVLMGQLMDLKERADKRNAEIEFNQAFSRLQTKLPRVTKNGQIDLGKGKPIPFAKWEDVDRSIRPILAEEGFALSFTSKAVAAGVLMICNLTHSMGHSTQSEMQLPPDQGPGRNNLQAIGSSRSYGKRYLACDILNIVCESQDDDGSKAEPLSTKEYENVRNMLDELELSPVGKQNFLKFAGAPSVELIQRHKYEAVMQGLRDKLKAKREGQS